MRRGKERDAQRAADASRALWTPLCAAEAELGAEKNQIKEKNRNRAAGAQPQGPGRVLFFKRLLGICFLRGALEVAVEGIGDGEKGG